MSVQDIGAGAPPAAPETPLRTKLLRFMCSLVDGVVGASHFYSGGEEKSTNDLIAKLRKKDGWRYGFATPMRGKSLTRRKVDN